MTDQEIFNKVVVHLFLQNGKALDDSGKCMYRVGILKCAVGCLIPDHLYDSIIEGLGISDVIEGEIDRTKVFKNILDKINITPEQYPLLLDLQAVHDHEPVQYWRECLRHIAIKHNLVWVF